MARRGSRDKVFSPTAEGDRHSGDGMPAVDLVERKRRRRVAARTLLSRKREAGRHLVDGVQVDSLPFDSGEAAHQELAGAGRVS